MPTDTELLGRLLPEAILVLLSLAIFIGGTFVSRKVVWVGISVVTLLCLSLYVWRQGPGPEFPTALGASVLSDHFAYVFRLIALLVGVLFLLFATQSRQERLFPELTGLLLLVILGTMVVASASNLVLMFMGFELISIPTYALLFLGRSSRDSDEAATKYFFLSMVSSALMLYGFATLYGITGSIRFSDIQSALSGTSAFSHGLLPIALVTILAGLSFKLAAVPFHFYAPDVYQAATNFNAGLLATIPKLAGVLGMVRLLVVAFPHESAYVWQLAVLLAVATMTFGNLGALWQTNVRRLMAYSSIAHAGYLLIGLAVALGVSPGGALAESAVAGMGFYVVAYAAGSIGMFAALGYLSDNDRSFSEVGQLSGVGRDYPIVGACIAVSMFSLAGIPPLPGFWGKLALIKSSLDLGLQDGPQRIWYLSLCVIAMLNAAVAAAYYLRIVSVLYFQEADNDHSVMPVMGNAGAGVASVLSVLLLVSVGLFTGRFMAGAQRAASSIWFDEVAHRVEGELDSGQTTSSTDRYHRQMVIHTPASSVAE